MHDLPIYDGVVTVATRIAGHANHTPVTFSRTLDEELGAEVFFKRGNLQCMGAFKLRGVLNTLSRFSVEQHAAGVVVFSSDNHAQAIALSVCLLGISAAIVMPIDVSAMKIEATRGYGGQVVLYDRYTEDHEQIDRSLAQRHGLALIPFYDRPDVPAGQGTAVEELFEGTGPLDAFFASLGGGDLLSDCALAIRALIPACRIYGVEPEVGSDGRRLPRSGATVHIDTPQTLADGAQIQHLDNLIFSLIRRSVDDILTTGDVELVDGVHFLVMRIELLVEPTGYFGLAAAHQHKDELCGKRIRVLLSGGNVDLVRFCALLDG